MSTVHEWSVRLANEVAPDEAELALMMTEAFVRGGKERQELFSRGENVPGGIGFADIVTVFPYILSAIAFAEPQLLKTLRSSLVGDYLACVKNALSLLEIRKKSKAAQAMPQLPADDSYLLLRQVTDALYNELRKSKGLSEERCAAICFRVLRVFLEDPRGASAFVQEVAMRR